MTIVAQYSNSGKNRSPSVDFLSHEGYTVEGFLRILNGVTH